MPAHREIAKLLSLSRRRVHKIRAFHRDLANILLYEPAAPRYAEQLWIKPEHCSRFIPSSVLRDVGLLKYSGKPRGNTGCVISQPWPVSRAISIHSALGDDFAVSNYPANLSPEFVSLFKFRACHDHWVKGVSWRDTGIYDLLLRLISYHGRPVDHGCKIIDDIIARYDRLDTTFEQIQREGRFRTKKKSLAKKLSAACRTSMSA